MGGANWPPSSYDPDSHLLYVCASDRINSFSVQESLNTPVANQVYMGGRFVQANADDRGILAALDVRTNKLAWRQQWREICYSGSVVTGGGLLFVGRNSRLGARQGNGKSLWGFGDAGVNTTVTTFDWNGDQRVVVHAGGGVFAGAQRGDGIWMFSVKGTMKSLPVGGALTGGGGGPGGAFGARPSAPPENRPVSVDHGRQLYAEACVACHGEQGDGGRRWAITRRGAARGHDRRHREGGEEQHAAVRTRVFGRRSQGRRGLRRRRAREEEVTCGRREFASAEHEDMVRFEAARGIYRRAPDAW
jgi:mono/diheme cytochrome c family protein